MQHKPFGFEKPAQQALAVFRRHLWRLLVYPAMAAVGFATPALWGDVSQPAAWAMLAWTALWAADAVHVAVGRPDARGALLAGVWLFAWALAIDAAWRAVGVAPEGVWSVHRHATLVAIGLNALAPLPWFVACALIHGHRPSVGAKQAWAWWRAGPWRWAIGPALALIWAGLYLLLGPLASVVAVAGSAAFWSAVWSETGLWR